MGKARPLALLTASQAIMVVMDQYVQNLQARDGNPTISLSNYLRNGLHSFLSVGHPEFHFHEEDGNRAKCFYKIFDASLCADAAADGDLWFVS